MCPKGELSEKERINTLERYRKYKQEQLEKQKKALEKFNMGNGIKLGNGATIKSIY